MVGDARGPSFRHELFADYKATRDAQPEELSVQFPVVREVVEEQEEDFGPVFIGYPASLALTVANVGTEPLVVYGITSDQADFSTDLSSFTVPVGDSRGVVNWTGRATFLTVFGVLTDTEGVQPCSWFCRFDIESVGTFPDAQPSLSRIKALY